ncbi:MAG: hypothetical protein Ta2E_01930 [Mycoplasmoidaceae bacterium]|nr:MAG: hypothetical protein Ta2E_01930 [Mycoplasmoidaceae bacterium]
MISKLITRVEIVDNNFNIFSIFIALVFAFSKSVLLIVSKSEEIYDEVDI